MTQSRAPTPLFGSVGRLLTVTVLVAFWLPASGQWLWKVEAEGLQPSWLLATVHADYQAIGPLPTEVEEVYSRVDRLALQLVPDLETLSAFGEAMYLPPPESLEPLIGTARYRRVVEALNDYGVGEPAIHRMRPWAVALTLATPPPVTGLFMDVALALRAGADGKPVHALETLDEQLAFLAGLGREAHIQLLSQALDDVSGGRERYHAILDAYLNGDLERVWALAEQQFQALGDAGHERLHSAGIAQRTATMLERMGPLLDEGNSLIVVGALHFTGPSGLIEQLRAGGFRVEAVRLDGPFEFGPNGS